MGEPVSHGSTERRRIQRSIPPASKEEHLERLCYDIDTVLQLQLQSYSDEAWEPVASALAEYGFGVIKGWLYTGEIFSQVARTGFGALPRCSQDWLDDDTIEELAGETVSEALHYFKFEVLMKNQMGCDQRSQPRYLLRRSVQVQVRQHLQGLAPRPARVPLQQ